jgi:hypothetical protein
MFFFEKKNQKTFAPLRVDVPPSASHQTNKVFFAAFLFTKKKTLPSFIALLFYALISIICIGHGTSLSTRIFGQGSDPYQFIWFLAWFPWAIAHHQSLFVSQLMWQPLGLKLLWISSVPLLCLALIPLTKLAGPIITYNLMVLAAPVLSAWAAYLLAFHVTRDRTAALIGGFLFGFSSYEAAMDYATPNLSFTFLLPCLVWLAMCRLQGGIGRPGAVALAVIMLFSEFFISIEIFAMSALFGGMAWLAAYIAQPAQRPPLLALLIDALLAGAITTLLLAPFLAEMLAGGPYINIPTLWPYFFVADPVNWFIPSALTWAGGAWAKPIAMHFPGILQEQGTYLGLPLIIIFYHAVRRGQVPIWLRWLLGIFLVLSLGPALWIGGRYTGLPLPWALFLHVPLISAALPARFALYVSLIAAMLVPLWIIAAPAQRAWRLGLAGLACLALLPAPHLSVPVPNAIFFQPGHVQQALGPDPVILVLPFGGTGPSTYWQEEAGFSYRQTGGYMGFPPRAMQHYAAVGQLFGNVQHAGFTTDLVTFLQATHTGYVVAGPGTPPALRTVLDSLAWPHWAVDDVVIYTVPHA